MNEGVERFVNLLLSCSGQDSKVYGKGPLDGLLSSRCMKGWILLVGERVGTTHECRSYSVFMLWTQTRVF